MSNNFNNIRKITATDEKDLLILNGDKELYKYNFENNLMEIALVANNKINDFGIYGGKLYTLQSDTNQILKHFPIETGYNSGSNWIKDGSNMENIISITIDGGIYTADTNGEIKYFMAGKSEPTNLSIIDPPLSSPKQLFSKIDSNYLYILDQNNNKIIVIDKNSGNIKIQYLSKEFKNIKSIIVEEQEKKIYVLSDKKIYLIEMNF